MTDKSRIIIVAVCIAVVAASVVGSFGVGYHYGHRSATTGTNSVIVRRDTLIHRDTVIFERPIFKTQFVTDTLIVAVVDTLRDTVFVELPRTTRIYEDTDYRAQVSGYEPTLDRIEVFPKTVTVTETEIRTNEASKWSFGVGIGPGVLLDFKGQPHVGIAATVGVNYRFGRTH